jgi:hypothetical protein
LAANANPALIATASRPLGRSVTVITTSPRPGSAGVEARARVKA